MTEIELERIVAALPEGRRRVYEGIRDGGGVTMRELHTSLGRSGAPRFTDDLRPLLAEGLIRRTGKRNLGRGLRADIYEAVPAEQVEDVRAINAVNQTVWQQVNRANSVVAGYKAKVEKLRKLEHGSARHWIRFRRRVVDITGELVVCDRDNMAWWECSDADDRLTVVEELLDLHGWTERTIEDFADRLDDDELREKVRQIREVHGREPEEIETYRRKAAKLSRKLAQRR